MRAVCAPRSGAQHGTVGRLGPSYSGFSETKTFVGVDLFLGAMFGLPKAQK